MTDNLIQPDEVAYRLQLTAAELKIVHTALKALSDDLGHEEHDVNAVHRAAARGGPRGRQGQPAGASPGLQPSVPERELRVFAHPLGRPWR